MQAINWLVVEGFADKSLGGGASGSAGVVGGVEPLLHLPALQPPTQQGGGKVPRVVGARHFIFAPGAVLE